MKFKLYLVWLLMAGLCLPLSAQVKKSTGLHFRTLGWQVATAGLFYEEKGKDREVAVYESARSVFYSHPKTDKISFYTLTSDAAGKQERALVAEADISAAGPCPLLIFFKDETRPGKFKVSAIPDDLKSFPVGSYRFINFTPVELGASLGKSEMVLPPKSIQLADRKAEGSDKTLFARVYVTKDSRRIMLYSNNWGVFPLMRTMVFVMYAEGRPQVLRIMDSIDLPEDDLKRIDPPAEL